MCGSDAAMEVLTMTKLTLTEWIIMLWLVGTWALVVLLTMLMRATEHAPSLW
jgi:hypothetical protein